MSTVLWIIIATAYFALLVTLGMMTLRRGHILLFAFGIFLPFLWFIGAFMAPTSDAAAAEARSSLR